MLINEPSLGSRNDNRRIEITLKLLGAFHDGHIHLQYKNVSSYSLYTPKDFEAPPIGVGHGDWLIDEVRLSDAGLVIHDIRFSRGSKWTIESEDIVYRWEPLAQ